MRKQYKDNMGVVFRWMPNGIIHTAIIIMIPLYLVVGVFKGGLIETMQEWWGEFNSKWVFSDDYLKKNSK